jgi:ribose/xylose/arabinose/galactoside ABC-type transport system permease subunit
MSPLRTDNLVRLGILAALVVGFGLLTGGVTWSPRGLLNILLQSSTTGLAAVGQAFVMLTGAIDVSLYGIGVLASVVGAATMTSRPDLNIVGGDPVPVVVGVGLMLAVAVAMGAANGVLVSRVRIPALIATLGTWQIGFGLAQLIGGGYTIANLAPGLSALGQGTLAGIPLPVAAMLASFAVAAYVLHFTTFGRSVYAVGGNPASAHLSGIGVRKVQFLVFVISGLMVGLAAVSIESRMMAASLRTLSGLQLDSIAAVAVGGVSVYGGRGSILGVLLGTLTIAVLDSGLGTLGAGTEVLNTVKGTVIILAVGGDFFRGSRLHGLGSLRTQANGSRDARA